MLNTRCTSLIRKVILLSILTIQATLLAHNATQCSPTFNEPAHLAAGLNHWKTATFQQYRVNPHLVRTVAVVPVLFVGYNDPSERIAQAENGRYEFSAGRRFVQFNSERFMTLLIRARWACIPFCLLGSLVCYMWAKDLYGPKAGILACLMWSFSPDILAHGSLITTDAHASAMGIAASYLFWKWLTSRSWTYMLAAGLSTGLAILSKSTLLLLLPAQLVLVILADCQLVRTREYRSIGTSILSFAFVVLFALYIVHVGYLFHGSLTPLEHPQSRFFADIINSKGDHFWYRPVRVAMSFLPYDFVAGLDAQHFDFEHGGDSYLNGEFRQPGWWYYYLFAFLIKTPISIIILVAASVVSSCCNRSKQGWLGNVAVLLPSLLVLLMVSSQTGFTKHYRYVLPCLPFLYIWCSGLCSESVSSPTTSVGLEAKWRHFFSHLFVGMAVLESLIVYPHCLSFFNVAAGGTTRGSHCLIDSNIDWGQDMLRLARWQKHKNDQLPLYVALYTDIEPKWIGVECQPIPLPGSADRSLKLKPGWYAVSVSMLRGMPWYGITGKDGTSPYYFGSALKGFQHLKPSERVGGSILIYKVPQPITLPATNAE